jgi:hypothetical protein
VRQTLSRMCCWVLAFTSAAVIFGAASPSNRLGKPVVPLSFASSPGLLTPTKSSSSGPCEPRHGLIAELAHLADA